MKRYGISVGEDDGGGGESGQQSKGGKERTGNPEMNLFLDKKWDVRRRTPEGMCGGPARQPPKKRNM